MKKTIYVILAMAFLFANRPLFAQPREVDVSSRIENIDGKPISDAVISTQNGQIQTITNENGEYTITVPSRTQLIIEKDGYDKLKLNLKNATEPIIMEAKGRNAIVNIPFGKQRQRELTGAVAVLNSEDIAEYNNIQQALDIIEARTLGVLSGGNIRGQGEALVVVDGIPRYAGDLVLEEVDQITVLKDANASVLYGTMARNGVILITTKRGKANRNVMNAFVERGVSSAVRYPNYLGSADYMRMRNLAMNNDGLPHQFPDSVVANFANPSNQYRYPSVDYYSNEFINRSFSFNRVVTEFSGGNENTTFYTNLGWNNSGSHFKIGNGQNAGNNRLNLRANVNYKITEFITGRTDGVFVLDIDNGPNNNFWENAATLYPNVFSPLLPTELIDDQESLENAELVNGNYILGGTSQFRDNVYGDMILSGTFENIRRTVQFNNGIDFDLNQLVKGLEFRTNLSFDIYNRFSQVVDENYSVYEPNWATDVDSITSINKIGNDDPSGVQNIGDAAFFRRLGFFGVFDYNTSFGENHHLTANLLGYYNRVDRENEVMTDKQIHAGLRINYNYANKYYVDLSSTLNNSIKLADGNRGGLSPTLGVAWVMSEEDFLANNNFVDFLKLRASAGLILTDIYFGHYLYESTFLGSNNFNWWDNQYSNSSTIQARSANPNLGFERITNLNFGIEGSILNNALDFTANVFYTKHSDRVTRRNNAYPAYIGPNYPYENYEADLYTGAELGINWRAIDQGDFSLSFGGNLLFMQSEMLIRDELWANDYQNRAGNPLGTIYGLKALGLFQDSTEILNSPAQVFGEVRPGDIKYKDQNDDGVIDQNDQVAIGVNRPDISFGINLMINYRNFSLFALGSGTGGDNRIFDNDYFWVDGNDKYSEEVLNSWTPETAKTATYPRLTTGNNNNNFRTSTYWLTNDAMFNISHVQLTYDVPDAFMGKIGIKTANIYLRGQNLLTFAKNLEKREIQIGSSPLLRNYALGLRLFF